MRKKRKGWEKTFKEMAKNGDDKLLEMPESSLDEEEKEIIKDYEKGQYKSVENVEEEKQKLINLSKKILNRYY